MDGEVFPRDVARQDYKYLNLYEKCTTKMVDQLHLLPGRKVGTLLVGELSDGEAELRSLVTEHP